MTAPENSHADPQTPLSSQLGSKPSYLVLWLAGFGIIAAGVWYVTKERTGAPGTPAEQIAALKKNAAENAAFAEQAEQTGFKTTWKLLRSRLELTLADETAANEGRVELARRLKELESSDAGRRIAASEALVQQFQTLQAQARRQSVDSLSDQGVENLVKQCDQALNQQKIVIEADQKLFDQARRLQDAAAQDRQQVEQSLLALSVMVKSAEELAPAAATLNTAVERQKQEQAKQQLDKLTAERAALEKEAAEKKRAQEIAAAKKLKDEELERERIAEESRLAEARAKTKREQEALRAAEEKRVAEQARAEKLKKFEKELPEIKSLLSPMISKGKMQLTKDGWFPGPEGPLSLAALKGHRVLELTPQGTSMTGTLFCGTRPGRNDRDQGSFPVVYSYHEKHIRRAQDLLVEYSDILVEKGMLRP